MGPGRGSLVIFLVALAVRSGATFDPHLRQAVFRPASPIPISLSLLTCRAPYRPYPPPPSPRPPRGLSTPTSAAAIRARGDPAPTMLRRCALARPRRPAEPRLRLPDDHPPVAVFSFLFIPT